MTPLGTTMVASAGIYAFVAAHYGGLWSMRRQAEEHGAFALLAAALVPYALAAAAVSQAHDVASAAIAQRCLYSITMFAWGSYVGFCVRMSGARGTKLEAFSWRFAALFAMASAAGLFVDPARPSPGWDGTAFEAGGRLAADVLLPARICFSVTMASSLAALARLGAAARRDRGLRGTFGAACIPFVAAAWDMFVRLTGAHLPILSPIAPVLAIAAISWALVARLVRVDSDLAVRTNELAKSYETLGHAQQELVRKEQLAAVGELSAVIAHEVRNPLAIIRSSVSGLRKSELEARDAETLLGILDEEADRLNRLVQDLLAYARPVAPEPRTVDLDELVRRAVELAREGQPDRRNIEFAVRSEAPNSTVDGDPALLRHALINIVDNAIQAMPDGGTVTITCRTAHLDQREAIAIDFHDEGEGMDTLVRSKARDPFFTTRSSGTGLGLAIVDRVARVHGGRIEIESKHGAGTTVTLLLPRDRTSLPAPGSFG